jgi:uncharacterized protein (DUF1684 family)
MTNGIRNLLLLVLIVLSQKGLAQPWRKEARNFRTELEKAYRDSAHSPLKGEALNHFPGHDFFRLKKAYCLNARFVPTPGETPFDMMTSSGKTKRFVKYGELHFRLQNQNHQLAAYRRLAGPNQDEPAPDLFVPFKDLSCGQESYGGGRYLDLPLPEGDQVTLDFNRCYNPYCAYSTGWNCPIPPMENHLNIKVLAGIKNPKSTSHQ